MPRLLRWPLTGAALLFLAVIVVNLTGGEPSEVERSFQIPPGGVRTIEVPVAAGRNSEVRWEIGGRDADAAGFPLRATLRGPDGELASALGSGRLPLQGRLRGGALLAGVAQRIGGGERRRRRALDAGLTPALRNAPDTPPGPAPSGSGPLAYPWGGRARLGPTVPGRAHPGRRR